VRAGLERRAREGRRLLAAAFLGEATVAGARGILARARVPAYATPEEAVRALLDLATFERRQQALREVPPAEPLEERPQCGAVRALVRQALAAGRRELGRGELVRLLDAYELPPPGTGEGRGGVEVVLRARPDATFGPVIRVAQGGPGEALIGEVAAGLPPLNRMLAEAMLEETALGRLLLAGGDPRLPDPAYVVDALVRLSRLVVDRPEVATVTLELRLSREAGLETLCAAVGLEPVPEDADPAARLAVRPYPVELEEVVTLRDGAAVKLRPIRPEDARALQRAFRRMSPEDARLRLFGPARELLPELAARLTQIDYDRELALVAEDPESPGDLIGGARVTMDADGRRAEFAVTVRSDHKRRGLGRIALERVIGHARSRGVEEVWGSILAENRAMIGLARSLGFEIRRDPDEPEAVLAVKRLAA
jgi:acetyltransferase